MTTNVPVITWVNGAPLLPTEAQILAGVQADINAAFGGAVNPGLTTPQGQIAQSETAIIGDKNSQIAYMASQFDPQTASGQWQDALGEIYFLSRIQASGTVVTATVVGAVGTVIPAGALAQDTSRYLYACTAAVTIPAGGTTTAQFQNHTSGPIACGAGTLTTIYTAVPGWDTITNAAAGVLGTNVETRADFENRRQLSVAANSVNSVQSILAAVLAVPNVLDAYVAENATAAAVNYGATSYSIPAFSIVVSVAGGVAASIGQAIWNKKSVGCGMAGNTSVTVYDTSAQYAPNFPAYTITWLTPTAVPTYFAVRIVNNPALLSNIVSLVQNAIIAAFTGQDGGLRARIGSTVYAGRFYAGITAVNPNVSILSVYLGTAASPTTTSQAYGIDQLPTLSAANISVTLV